MEKKGFLKNRSKSLMQNLILVIVLVVLCVAMIILKPDTFPSGNNIFNLLRATSIKGIIAIAMTFVILTGGIDLSVGSIMAFVSVTCAGLISFHGWTTLPAVLVSIVAGTLVGVINGAIIHKGKIAPFIVTLGTMKMFSGAAFIIADARTISGLPDDLTGFAQLRILGLPSLFITWVVFIIAASIIIKWTRFGRNTYAIGSNIESARLSGINVGRTTVGVYGLSGFCCAVAGLLFTSRITNGQPSAGTGYEMEAIASAVIGGCSMTGGEGTIAGTVIGALIMQVLVNGGNLLGLNSFIMDIVVGALVIIAVLIDQSKKGKGR